MNPQINKNVHIHTDRRHIYNTIHTYLGQQLIEYKSRERCEQEKEEEHFISLISCS